MKNIGVIGGGLIGASWAAIFSKSGFNVFVYDPYPDVFDTYKSRVTCFLEELQTIDETINVEESLNRINANITIEDLCSNVEYIQESAPEILSVKQELFAKLDNLAPEEVVIGSSSSAMPISSITQNLKGQHRCIITHPANPPHLIPVSKFVPDKILQIEQLKRQKKFLLLLVRLL